MKWEKNRYFSKQKPKEDCAAGGGGAKKKSPSIKKKFCSATSVSESGDPESN